MSTPRLTAPSARPAPAKIHLGYLDGIRALAALYVILHHSYQQFDFSGSSRLVWMCVQRFAYGHYAVDIFIVLSGFCLMLPTARGDGFLRGGPISFYLKRARRILPPYFFAMGVSLALIALLVGRQTGTHWDVSIPVTLKGVLLHVFMLQDLVGNTEINHAFWSVSVEWRIYFLFPLLVILFRRRGSVATTAATVALSYVVWAALAFSPMRHYIDTFSSGCSPYYLGLFAMGMLAAKFAFSGPPESRDPAMAGKWARAALVSAIVVLVLTHARFHHGKQVPPTIMSGFVGFFGMCFLVWVSVNSRSWASRLLSWRPLVFLGTYAYSIYLIHAPLVQVVWQYIVRPITHNAFAGWLLMVFPGVPLILGAAYLFFLAFERPFLTSRRKETVAETERDAALSPAP